MEFKEAADFLILSGFGLVYLVLWASTLGKASGNAKWLLLLPIWFLFWDAYGRDGRRVCVQATIVVVLMFAYAIMIASIPVF